MLVRAVLTMAGLTAWLAVGLGSRAYFGGKAYLAELLGSATLADDALRHALEQPEALLLGMSPYTLLLSFSLVVSAALVLVVLSPCDWLLRRKGWARGRRALVGVTLAAAATGAALSSVHPLLSLPSVPEGPRTVLNYACEAAGYGWVNAIAYAGAIVTAVALAWLGGEGAAAHAIEPVEPAAPEPAAPEPAAPEPAA